MSNNQTLFQLGYRNKTYVIFDGDNDIWAYKYMRGWKKNKNINFNFHDAHEVNVLTRTATNPSYIKKRLRERFKTAKQIIVLIGEKTKNLYRFVRWEIQVAQELGLPIIAVNLNGKRVQDDSLVPPILRNEFVVHISFKAKIIKYALDNFPSEFRKRGYDEKGSRYYPKKVYTELGI